MADAIPFRAPSLSPLQAHLYNMLCTRERPWRLFWADRECLLDLTGIPSDPAYVFDIRCGDLLWKLETGCPDLVRLHPALAGVPADATLPSDLVQAILEIMFSPLVARAQKLLDTPLELEACHPVPESGVPVDASKAVTVELLLRVPLAPAESALFGEKVLVDTASDADVAKTVWLPVPLRFTVSDRESVMLLNERLGTLPCHHVSQPDLPVTVIVEAGRMTLTSQELSGLEAGDVLFPDSYPAADGTVILSLGCRSWLCTIENHTVTIASSLNPVSSQEMSMSESNAESSMPEGVVVGDLELPVVFELERRLLTVRDVESLAPGYTFALGCDALAPVTLTVNGRSVGRGRLVDLNGMLGVQLVEVGTAANEAGVQA